MEIILNMLKSGDSFGEVALIDDMTCNADVSATVPIDFYVSSREDFLAALYEHP